MKRSQRRKRLRVRAAVVEDAEHPRKGHLPAIDFVEEALHRLEIEMADDLRQIELGAEARVEKEIHLLCRRGMRIGPAAERETGLAFANRDARRSHACSTHRGWPTDVSPPRTTSDENPCCHACSAYDRQKSSECLLVRNGVTRSCGSSRPRFAIRCRRLFSSGVPTALSVRKAGTRCLPRRTDLVVAVDPRIHALHRAQLGSRRTKLHGHDGGLAAKRVRQHLLARRPRGRAGRLDHAHDEVEHGLVKVRDQTLIAEPVPLLRVDHHLERLAGFLQLVGELH